MTVRLGWTHPTATALAGVIILGLSCGCESTSNNRTDLATRGPEGGSTAAAPSLTPQAAAKLERDYVIGPAAARELDYRIDWQYAGAGRNVRHLSVQGDSVFVLDGDNFLTRIKTADGTLLWRVPAAKTIEEVAGVTFLNNRVYLTTGGALIVLDGANGTQIDLQPFTKIANTEPVVFGDYMIYGSRNGQLVWHAYNVAFQWRSYQVSNSIQVPPVASGDFVVAIGTDGKEATVMVLNTESTNQYWNRNLLSTVVAPPAVSDEAVFVASLDQHLRAFEISSGRYLWKVLTESPLTDPPVLMGDHLYQQIPSRGLACFNAYPIDKPGGEEIWTSSGTKGTVILKHGDSLFAWDKASASLNVVEAARGGRVKTVSMPQVKHMIAAGDDRQEIVAASNNGRVVRLVPRN